MLQWNRINATQTRIFYLKCVQAGIFVDFQIFGECWEPPVGIKYGLKALFLAFAYVKIVDNSKENKKWKLCDCWAFEWGFRQYVRFLPTFLGIP